MSNNKEEKSLAKQRNEARKHLEDLEKRVQRERDIEAAKACILRTPDVVKLVADYIEIERDLTKNEDYIARLERHILFLEQSLTDDTARMKAIEWYIHNGSFTKKGR
jgi:hypothetical protein